MLAGSLSVVAALVGVSSAQGLGNPAGGNPGPPVAGAMYTGQIEQDPQLPITFKVSGDGQEVTDIQIPQPLQLICAQGKAGPNQTSDSQPVAIDPSTETFSATFNQQPLPNEPGTLTVTVTGQFLANGAEAGEASFTYPLTPQGAAEFGCTAPYTQTGLYSAAAALSPLPNPCKLPSSALAHLEGRGTTPGDGKLSHSHENAPDATATCTFGSGSDGIWAKVFIGYVSPSTPRGTVTTVKGFPTAELITSTKPLSSSNYFTALTFRRRVGKRTLYGEVWKHGASCNGGYSASVEIPAEDLDNELGSGHLVSVRFGAPKGLGCSDITGSEPRPTIGPG
jgi:hypothetical protein